MLYTFIKISGREDASLDRYWIDPSGGEHYVNGYKGTHMMWIFDNQELLPEKERAEINAIGRERAEAFAGKLYDMGWVRISEDVVLMGSDRGMGPLGEFIRRHVKDSNLDVSPAKKLTIIKMNPETHIKVQIADILRKNRSNPLQMAASFGRMSGRDAVKDTINYWDKAKNKDFSKYWRKLKKNKKKANYIPNPKTTVEQPLKKNYDYGEIPNYVDRLRWFNKKERAKKRKADLDTI